MTAATLDSNYALTFERAKTRENDLERLLSHNIRNTTEMVDSALSARSAACSAARSLDPASDCPSHRMQNEKLIDDTAHRRRPTQ